MAGRLRGWLQAVVGWAVLVVGIALWPLPGPGLLVMLVGMIVLANRYDWAERRLDWLRDKALESAKRGVDSHLKAWSSILVCALLAASGFLWVWDPGQPAWWSFPDWTWLPGGLWAGVSQVLSGAVTLGLVVYAYWCRLTSSGWLAP